MVLKTRCYVSDGYGFEDAFCDLTVSRKLNIGACYHLGGLTSAVA